MHDAGAERNRADLTYRTDDAGRRTLSGWEYRSFRDSNEVKFESCEVTSATFDAEMPPSLFRIEHAPGMVVWDVAADRKFVVPKPGQRAMALAEAFPSSADRPSSRLSMLPYLIGAIALGLLIVAGVLWRKRFS
jgi:hypothetical protein